VEVYQLWLEDLQPALKFLQLMVKFVFDFGGFACFVTYVNIHVCLGWEKFPYEGPKALSYRRFYTCLYDATYILYVA
jgi:hypothetical protein